MPDHQQLEPGCAGYIPQLTAAQVSLIHKSVTVLDVREPAEVATGRISGSTNIPLEELPGRWFEVEIRRPVVVVCQSGQRSYRAAQLLSAAGFMVSHLDGGINGWIGDGNPTV